MRGLSRDGQAAIGSWALRIAHGCDLPWVVPGAGARLRHFLHQAMRNAHVAIGSVVETGQIEIRSGRSGSAGRRMIGRVVLAQAQEAKTWT